MSTAIPVDVHEAQLLSAALRRAEECLSLPPESGQWDVDRRMWVFPLPPHRLGIWVANRALHVTVLHRGRSGEGGVWAPISTTSIDGVVWLINAHKQMLKSLEAAGANPT